MPECLVLPSAPEEHLNHPSMDIAVVAILCLSYAVNARQLWVYSCNKGFQETVCACLTLLGTTITTSWEGSNCNSPYNGLQPKAQPSPREKCRTCCINVTKLGPAERVPRLFQETGSEMKRDSPVFRSGPPLRGDKCHVILPICLQSIFLVAHLLLARALWSALLGSASLSLSTRNPSTCRSLSWRRCNSCDDSALAFELPPATYINLRVSGSTDRARTQDTRQRNTHTRTHAARRSQNPKGGVQLHKQPDGTL